VRNESGSEAGDVDWDWRVDHSRKKFDRKDTFKFISYSYKRYMKKVVVGPTNLFLIIL